VTLSVAFYGIKGGVWTVMTGGGGRVWGPPGGLIQGNNELAVALVMLLPMLYWMRQTAPRAWARHLMTFSMISCAFSILGSQSRGALLALLAMSLFLGFKSKHPVRMTVVVLAAVVLAIGFMPDTWTERMETIREYQTDGSAMSRIWTWQTLWNAAVDRPFVGAGFQADNAIVFSRYSPSGPEWQVFEGAVYVAHSIYFQILGEHGFVGLGLFLLLWLMTWHTAGRVARQAEADPSLLSWMPLLMRMVQVSLVGYAVGGAFLSLGYFDLPYYFIAYVVLSGQFLRRAVVAAAPVVSGTTSPAMPSSRPA
jgi:probable O-glycosylation ligase (exosortase A-associated)